MHSTNRKWKTAAGKLSLIALAVIASNCAVAQVNGWYGGVSAGQTQSRIDDSRIAAGLMGAGATQTTIVDSDRDNGYKVYGGYQLNKYWALEGGYFNLGQFGFKATTAPAGTLNGNIKVEGINADIMAMLPLTDRFSLTGSIGANYAESRDTFTGTGVMVAVNPNPSVRDTNLKVGLGMQYALTDSLSVRADLERYRINDAVGNRGDVDMATLGLVFRFGAKTPKPVARAVTYEPVVVAQAPAPRPEVVVAPPPMPIPAPVPVVQPLRRVSFSAESLFGFDQANMQTHGQLPLDNFVKEMQGTQYDLITVQGHTDRLGSKAYNQKLSEERAKVVKDYLVRSGLDAKKVTAEGMGEAVPVTKPEDCRGKLPRAKLITCLQPDRRVDVEVTGLR